MKWFIYIVLLGMHLQGSDWLMIQGTEPSMIKKDGVKVKNTISTPSFWGFAQLKAEKNYSDPVEIKGIDKSGFAYVAPNLQRQNQIQVIRARLGLRGVLDENNKINYFTLTDFGYNGIHSPAGENQHTYITDASITLRYIPYVNVRAGLMKYPGSEEGLQARFASPFINFTFMSGFLLLEKTPKSEKIEKGADVGSANSAVGAFRDTGVMLFNQFALAQDWALTYGAMLGNGSGLNWSNENAGQYTGYGYLSLQKSFQKGKGYYHQDFKTYLWYQEGKRQLEGNPELYERIRYGAGMRYYKEGLRLEAEYTKAKGMLFAGVRDQDSTSGSRDWHQAVETGSENEAHGFYLSGAYEFYPDIEVLARYDELDNLTNLSSKERIFKTTTLGLSYHFDGPTRIDLNYLFKDAQAPRNKKAQAILDNMGNVVNIQFTYKFGMRL